MKMTAEHFDIIAKRIKETFPAPALASIYVDYKKQGLSDMRFRWDLLHAAVSSSFICSDLYSYLNDGHIDTALRKITNT